MKKISLLGLFCLTFAVFNNAHAGYDNGFLKKEVSEGIDVFTARTNVVIKEDPAPGQLGLEVYQTKDNILDDKFDINIPTTMYIRMGGGINLGFLSDKADVSGQEVDLSGGWIAQMGLGWNLSSYVRTELDFQVQNFGFSGYPDSLATTRNFGGTLYFDLARRYVTTGDVIRRRTLVPFMGLGAGVGNYKFEGAGGTGGSFVAPRGILGLNVMFNDLVGMDLAYQYQMFIGNGFGWDAGKGGVQSISNIMLSLRMNF